MPKANITLPNGTSVVVEGTVDEIQALLTFYGGTRESGSEKKRVKSAVSVETTPAISSGQTKESDEASSVEIAKVVRSCDDADGIEENILDRTSQVDRCLLPLYILHEHLSKTGTLTTGDVAAVAKQLGISLRLNNVSKTLRGSARKYVVPHTEQKKGVATRYSISRAGVKYLKSVITGKSDD